MSFRLACIAINYRLNFLKKIAISYCKIWKRDQTDVILINGWDQMVKEIKPEVIKKSSEEMTAIIAVIEASNLPPSTKEFVMKCIGLACWLPGVLQKKNISLSRLRKILFGKGYKSSGRGGSGHSGGGSFRSKWCRRSRGQQWQQYQ